MKEIARWYFQDERPRSEVFPSVLVGDKLGYCDTIKSQMQAARSHSAGMAVKRKPMPTARRFSMSQMLGVTGVIII